MLSGKRVLVTGGTGSLGQILVRRLLSGRLGVPEKVVVLSRDEAKQHEMRLWYLRQRVSTDEVIYENFRHLLEFRIGDVRDYRDVCRAVRDADVVVNAAALKQVPTCEYFPDQAVLTNCVGAMNITQAIAEHDYGVEAVVAVSTDKACKPVNVMGMTKAIQERLMVAANVLSRGTRFVVVRYGNVLASRGSVIPLFLEQVRRGGPLTITAPGMTRFLLSLEEAVDVICAALAEALPGETYVPICPSCTVDDLARAMIGDRPIEMVSTGPRPGEKMHEVLVSEEEIRHVRRRGDYFAVAPMLPELSVPGAHQTCELTGEYSSAHDPLGVDDVVALLRKHDLLPEQQAAGSGELLR